MTLIRNVCVGLAVAGLVAIAGCGLARSGSETESPDAASSNASIGDLNGDGQLDIVLVKGRHWQVTTRTFFQSDDTVLMITLLRTMAGLPMLIISPIEFFRRMRNCAPASMT